MESITYNEFIKKYGIAINGLSQRISSVNGFKIGNEKLAQRLYQDSINKQVDMNDMTLAVSDFYHGNVLGQVKMNGYVEKYK